MKEEQKEKNKKVIRLTETGADNTDGHNEDMPKDKIEKLKKPIIFGLMGIVCLCCLYLIFKPASGLEEADDMGLNDAVPQASESGLPEDKGKAYEREMFEKKMEEKRRAMASLSDYWNEDHTDDEDEFIDDDADDDAYEVDNRQTNPAVSSYRNAQSTLSSFYDEPDYETQELRKEVEQLKEQMAERDVPKPVTVDDQLALMEKSYQMAAKYLPSNQQESIDTAVPAQGTATDKGHFSAFTPVRKNPVSALYREQTDSAFLVGWNEERNRGFYTAGVAEQVSQPKNSIRAVVQQTQVVTGENDVRLRLLETAQTPGRSIPAGTALTANAKFQTGRLQLHIASVELDENIIPVDITIYDIDGQQGLYVPYSPEMNAASEIAANMSQTSGTSLMMTRSAGQQIAGDLSRGVVQGVSGYFSKKVRTPKVTVKAGHQVFLVSKQ